VIRSGGLIGLQALRQAGVGQHRPLLIAHLAGRGRKCHRRPGRLEQAGLGHIDELRKHHHGE
jgi:hypothetical protein